MMNPMLRPPMRRKSQAGVTLIEVLIAGVVLVVGVLAVLALFMTAIGNNGRSKLDSSATMLSQAVIEQISAVLAGGGPGAVQDCAGTTWTIASDAGAPPTGEGARIANGVIDFTETAPPEHYHMDYAVCNGTAQSQYDVRWNVQQMPTGGTFLVTVGARPKADLGARFMFSLPVNMRTYVGR